MRRRHSPLNIKTSAPTFDQIERRPVERSHQLLVGGGPATPETTIHAVTIKGLAVSDGTTVWEYGPGNKWSHHYGADAITGIVPTVTNPWTADRYVIAATGGSTPSNIGNRNAGTLVANCAEDLSLVKLDSTDGTTVESATWEGMFVSHLETNFYTCIHEIIAVAALSGGDYCVAGNRAPAIELLSFASNGATKTYTLHAHNQQAGNVILKTRVDNEDVTIPYNSTAAAVETLIEAATGVTGATCTGGPWPHRKIEVEVVWSSSTNDFASIRTSGTAGTITYNESVSPGGGGNDILSFETLTVEVGATVTFWFTEGGAVFNYTSTTSNAATFSAALETAMNDFITAQGADGYWVTANAVDVAGVLEITYNDTLTLNVSGSTGGRVEGSVTTYDTGTGLITNSVGRVFGDASSASQLVAEDTASTSSTGTNPAGRLVAGPSDSVVVAGSGNWIQAWTVGTTWSVIWTKVGFSGLYSFFYPEGGSLLVNLPYKSYAIVASPFSKTVKAVSVAISSGTTAEIDSDQCTTSTTLANHRQGVMRLRESSTSAFAMTFLSRFIAEGSTVINYHLLGVSTTWDSDTDEALLDTWDFYGWDTSRVYGASQAGAGAIPRRYTVTRNAVIAGSIGKLYRYTWYAGLYEAADTGTEFRFRFSSSTLGVQYTGWVDWQATAATIKAAVLAVFPENTEGVVSNCVINSPGTPPALLNTTGLLDRNLTVDFAAGVFFGFIHPSYFATSAGSGVTIETRTPTAQYSRGITAWSTTDASESWSRAFGTKLGTATTIDFPQGGWLRGSYLYVWGEQLENELP